MADPRHLLGLRAEAAVAGWLGAVGWRVVAARARVRGGGEVDLVAVDPNATLVGIEIRARRTARTGLGGEAIDAVKLRRMHRTLVAVGRGAGVAHRALRLDLVTVTPLPGRPGRWRVLRTPGIER